MTDYRSWCPSKGWLRIAWEEHSTHEPHVIKALQAAMRIPGGHYSEEGAFIELPYTMWDLPEFHMLAGATKVDISDFPAWLPRMVAVGSAFGQPWSRELFPHQDEAYEIAATCHRGIVLADEMGLGKTSSAIAIAMCEGAGRAGERPGLVIGPAYTRMTWYEELLAMGAVTGPEDFCVLLGRRKNGKDFYRPGAKWYFVHYEVVSDWWSAFLKEPRERRPGVVIIDEAHWIKNGRAQRSKGAAVAASTAPKPILLTGTPLENRVSDMWHLLTVACGPRTWGHPNDFRRRYAGAFHNGYGLQDGSSVTNKAELNRRLETCYLRRTVDEVGHSLPEMSRTTIACDMVTAYKVEHDALLKPEQVPALVQAVLRGGVSEVLPLLTRLRQVTGYAKIPTTVSYLHSLIESNEAAVVFAWSRGVVNKIAAQLREDAYAITGEKPQEERDEIIKQFQGGGAPVLVATMGTLREGVTLHRARFVVMHDLDWVLQRMLQAEKRIHRIGQTRPCQSAWMVADKSIDTILAPMLKTKAEFAADVLGAEQGIEAVVELDLEAVAGARRFNEEVDRMVDFWRRQ